MRFQFEWCALGQGAAAIKWKSAELNQVLSENKGREETPHRIAGHVVVLWKSFKSNASSKAANQESAMLLSSARGGCRTSKPTIYETPFVRLQHPFFFSLFPICNPFATSTHLIWRGSQATRNEDEAQLCVCLTGVTHCGAGRHTCISVSQEIHAGCVLQLPSRIHLSWFNLKGRPSPSALLLVLLAGSVFPLLLARLLLALTRMRT